MLDKGVQSKIIHASTYLREGDDEHIPQTIPGRHPCQDLIDQRIPVELEIDLNQS